ncbi:MAG: hypothetical protein EP330_21655 [Deltaproteobacteria bacterium]|nr:MAG: hypothetical protein EP330_21655 [Deltaproteobacteria bacterium]
MGAPSTLSALSFLFFAPSAWAAAPLGCDYNVQAVTDTPAVVDCDGTQEDQAAFAAVDPGTQHQLSVGIQGSRGGNQGPFKICVPVPNGVQVDSEELRYDGTVVTPTWAYESVADANIQGHYCASYGTGRDVLPAGVQLIASLDVTYLATAAPNAYYFSASNTAGYAQACDTSLCYVEDLDRITQPINQYTADLEGCGFEILDVSASPTAPATCVDNPGAQTEGLYQPGSSHQLVYGMRVGQDADLGGTYAIRLPVPTGVSVADARLFLTTRSGTTELTGTRGVTLALDTSSADAAIQGHYQGTYDGGTAALVPGDKVWMSLDVTLGSFDAVFTDSRGASGPLSTDCSQNVGNGTACPVDNLPALTMQVQQYTADLEGCGFEFFDTSTTPTPPASCADNPAPQTSPTFQPGETVRMTYGMLNPDARDGATLAGNYKICLPLPIGTTYANETYYYTDTSGTTSEIAGRDTVWTLDTSTADSVKQGDLCVESRLPTEFLPTEKLWASVDLTLGNSEVTFGDALDNPGTVSTDCSQGGGNATVCPVDSLPLLTMPVQQYNAAIDGCGFTMFATTDVPAPLTASDCANNPGPQTLGPVEPGSSHTLVYGATVPAGRDTATLAGVFEICLPVPNGVTYTNTELFVSNAGGVITPSSRFTFDASTADATKDGDLCAEVSDSTLLEPGDVMWITADFTFGQFDAVFSDQNSNEGTVGTDCSLPGGNGNACPTDNLPLLTVEVKQYTANLQGCGFDFYATSATPDTPTNCADNPAPQTAPALNPGDTRTVVYGMLNPDARDAATLAGFYDICLPLPIGVTYANETLWQTQAGQSPITVGDRDTVWELRTASADSVKQGDLCVNSRVPALMEPGDTIWVSVDLTFPGNDVTFGDANDVPGVVSTDCSMGGGNATVCPVDSLPLLTVPTLGEPQILVTYSNGREIQTSENGTTDTVNFSLSRQPGADVIFNVISTDVTEGVVVGGAVITITRNGWDTGTDVTLQGVDDSLVDGNVTFGLTRTATVSADRNFDGLAETELLWTNLDNDKPGATVTPRRIATSESGTTADFTVVLNAEPTATTTIDISGLDATEGSLSTTSLSFDGSNWDTAQTVTVTGVDDAVIDGAVTYTLVLGAMQSGDSAFDGIAVDDVSVTNADDDSPGFTVTTDAGVGDEAALATSESGTTDVVRVVLNTQPTDTVTIPFSSSDATEGSVSATELVFTTANWNVPQVLTVTGVDDTIVDGTVSFDLIVGTVVSSDSDYGGLDPADIPWDNADDDTATVVLDIDPTTTTLTTTEAGGTDSFTVALSAEPADTVTVPFTSSNTAEGTVPASIAFDASNWDQPQTVTVTGVDDALQDGDIAYTVEIGALVSNDVSFDGLDPADIPAVNLDDDTAGVRVTPPTGTTTEAGGTETVSLVLTSAPTADVFVDLASTDTTEGTVSVATLTFGTGNWSTPQTVTVTGVDDALVDGTISYQLTTTVRSSDSAYDGLAAADVDLDNLDDDVGDLTVDAGTDGTLETSESGSTDTFTVALTAEPTADVTVSVAIDDATEASAAPTSLTFTAANWDTPQTVTVTGVDDTDLDGDIAFVVTLTAVSDDTTVSGVIGTLDGTNLDNDTPGVVVTPTSGLFTEESGVTETFDVVLTAAPSADVVIAVASDDDTEGETDVDTLTFTTANWSTAQTVTVTGLDDDLVDGDIDYTVVLSPATSSDVRYDGIDPDDVSLTNLDDGMDGGDSGDTGFRDSEDIWVQGGCECNASGRTPLSLTLFPLVLLPILRRRRSA